jgi:hypothetical protein
MKKLILAFSAFLLLAIVTMSFKSAPKNAIKSKSGIFITKEKNANGEWEFVLHNKTNHHIDKLWVVDVNDHNNYPALRWHEGHFLGGTHTIAPGGEMHLTLAGCKEGDYFLWTLDDQAHKGTLYKLHLDADVDVNDELEDDDDADIIHLFGKGHGDHDYIDLDDRDDD